MYRNIVVGTDGSESAGRAVSHAVDLARLAGAKLHVVRAVQPVVGDVTGVAVSETQVERIRAEANAALDRATADAGTRGVAATGRVSWMGAADAIIDLAEEVGADLIVVGSRGMTGKKRLFLGSVPNAVSHHAPCSVLIVSTS